MARIDRLTPRRLAGLIAIACGLVLVTVPLAFSMFDRTREAERVLDRFTFLTLGGNPDRYLAEAVTTRDGGAELVDVAIPELAADAGIEEAALAERHPALTALQAELPAAFDFSVRYSEQLEAVDDKFQSVYDIPVAWLPVTAVPWLFLASGIACLAAGALVLRTAGAAPLAATAALALALVLGPVVFGAVGKSADAEDVKDFAENGLTEKASAAAQAAWASLDRAVAETERAILPELAAARGVPAATLEAELERDHPDAAALLSEWDVIGPRLARLADAVTASVTEFDSARRLPIAFSVGLLMAAGLIMGVGAAGALAATRRAGARGSAAPGGRAPR